MAHAMAALRVKFCEASWECGWGLKVIPGTTMRSFSIYSLHWLFLTFCWDAAASTVNSGFPPR